MKILTCNPDGGAFYYILRQGITNALRLAGNTVEAVATKDVPSNFDLYLGCSGWRQNIPTKRTGPVGIHVNPYGPKKVGSIDGGPIIDESPEAIKWVVAQKPDFVYCYCTETFIPEYYGYWTSKHGIPVVPMPTAADITVYKPQPSEARFECEVGWVGGRWPYKAIMMDKYLVPLFTRKCLIFGWANTWGNNRSITDVEVPILFSSAKICPSVSESHTVYHPVDVPERVHKVMASGGFTIHTPSPAIPDMFGDVVPMAKDVPHWLDLVTYFLIHEDERKQFAARQRQLVLDKHTYFDRCQGIAKVLGNTTLADELRKAKAAIVGAQA